MTDANKFPEFSKVPTTVSTLYSIQSPDSDDDYSSPPEEVDSPYKSANKTKTIACLSSSLSENSNQTPHLNETLTLPQRHDGLFDHLQQTPRRDLLTAETSKGRSSSFSQSSAGQQPEADCLVTKRNCHSSASIRSTGHSASCCRSQQRKSRCSIADSPLRRPLSASSSDEAIESSDSHCHSQLKKGEFDKKARTKLILASVLCLLFMTGEMVGGLLAHSLAIVSDAAHLLTDFASFMISLMALYLAHRPATKKLSFGWYRIEILGAFISILMLWVLTGILVYSAVLRIMEDSYEIDATIMLITAATGVAFNIVLGTTLHQHSHGHGHSHGVGHSHGGGHGHAHGGGHHSNGGQSHITEANHTSSLSTPRPRSYGSIGDEEMGAGAEGATSETAPLVQVKVPDHKSHGRESNINVKAAFIHVIGDLFQSVGVLVAAFIIYYKPEWKIADPICTFMFSLFVLITTITIMRDIVVVLMEGTPRGINFIEVRETFFQVEGVLDIHNLRVWSLTMDKIALSVHLAIDKKADPHRVLKMASLAIQQKFNISETTMQIEEYVDEMLDCTDCQGPKL